MEADWSVELAPGDPAIVVPWRALDNPDPLCLQFIDLRLDPAAIDQIAEARSEPALRFALLALNGARSQLLSSKCGLWRSGPQLPGSPIDTEIVSEIDPGEMDAEPEDAVFAAGCYIDIVPLRHEAGASFAIMEHWLRRLTEQLRGFAVRCARADFVLRHAEIRGVQGFAVTWLIEACGATPEIAALRRGEALTRVLSAVLEVVPATSFLQIP